MYGFKSYFWKIWGLIPNFLSIAIIESPFSKPILAECVSKSPQILLYIVMYLSDKSGSMFVPFPRWLVNTYENNIIHSCDFSKS